MGLRERGASPPLCNVHTLWLLLYSIVSLRAHFIHLIHVIACFSPSPTTPLLPADAAQTALLDAAVVSELAKYNGIPAAAMADRINEVRVYIDMYG